MGSVDAAERLMAERVGQTCVCRGMSRAVLVKAVRALVIPAPGAALRRALNHVPRGVRIPVLRGGRIPLLRALLIPVLRGVAGAVLVASAGVAACQPDVVELRGSGSGAGSVARFAVEVADDASERAQGLMNRDKMASAAGMLFVYETPQRARFWMRNTLIPLDMIFADAAGVVTRVHENAVPLDETAIDGGDGVRFVLEINGGLARPLAIRPGSVLRHPAVPQDKAAWTCAD